VTKSFTVGSGENGEDKAPGKPKISINARISESGTVEMELKQVHRKWDVQRWWVEMMYCQRLHTISAIQNLLPDDKYMYFRLITCQKIWLSANCCAFWSNWEETCLGLRCEKETFQIKI
jgi:hypothetical protein